MHMKKVTQKDRYGNTVSYEFEAPEKPLDPTRLMEKQMELSMPQLESSGDATMVTMGGPPPVMGEEFNMGDPMNHPGEPKGDDTVPAWLTPGEFVVNAEATEMYGPEIEAMNNHGRQVQQMKRGGDVERGSAAQIMAGMDPAAIVRMMGQLGNAYQFVAPAVGLNEGGGIPMPVSATEALLHAREGFRDDVYLDSLGKPTVGYGHLLGDEYMDQVGTKPFAQSELDAMFQDDMAAAQAAARKNVGEETYNKLNRRQKAALDSMAFQLGATGQSKFKNMLAAIQAGDHDAVAREALTGSKPDTKSKWLRQTPKRAMDLAEAFSPTVAAQYREVGGKVYDEPEYMFLGGLFGGPEAGEIQHGTDSSAQIAAALEAGVDPELIRQNIDVFGGDNPEMVDALIGNAAPIEDASASKPEMSPHGYMTDTTGASSDALWDAFNMTGDEFFPAFGEAFENLESGAAKVEAQERADRFAPQAAQQAVENAALAQEQADNYKSRADDAEAAAQAAISAGHYEEYARLRKEADKAQAEAAAAQAEADSKAGVSEEKAAVAEEVMSARSTAEAAAKESARQSALEAAKAAGDEEAVAALESAAPEAPAAAPPPPEELDELAAGLEGTDWSDMTGEGALADELALADSPEAGFGAGSFDPSELTDEDLLRQYNRVDEVEGTAGGEQESNMAAAIKTAQAAADAADKEAGKGNPAEGKSDGDLTSAGETLLEKDPSITENVRQYLKDSPLGNEIGGALGSMFNAGELAKMAVYVAGSLAFGASPMQAMNFGVKKYLGGLEAAQAAQASAAANRQKQVFEAAKTGKFTPDSIKAFQATGDPAQLKSTDGTKSVRDTYIELAKNGNFTAASMNKFAETGDPTVLVNRKDASVMTDAQLLKGAQDLAKTGKYTQEEIQKYIDSRGTSVIIPQEKAKHGKITGTKVMVPGQGLTQVWETGDGEQYYKDKNGNNRPVVGSNARMYDEATMGPAALKTDFADFTSGELGRVNAGIKPDSGDYLSLNKHGVAQEAAHLFKKEMSNSNLPWDDAFQLKDAINDSIKDMVAYNKSGAEPKTTKIEPFLNQRMMSMKTGVTQNLFVGADIKAQHTLNKEILSDLSDAGIDEGSSEFNTEYQNLWRQGQAAWATIQADKDQLDFWTKNTPKGDSPFTAYMKALVRDNHKLNGKAMAAYQSVTGG